MGCRTIVLVITESPALEQMTFALLHAAGCSPELPGVEESAVAAIRRTRPDAVLLDCEHPAAVSDRFFEVTEEYRIGVLVCGRDTREADADIIARQQNVCRLPPAADGMLMAEAVAGALSA